MKKFRKLLSLVLAMVMVLAMAAPSFAQTVPGGDENPGATITIKNALKDETYEIYKLFDAKVTGTDGGSIAYTSTGDIPTELASYFTKDTAGNIKPTAAAGTSDNMSEGLYNALKTWASTATPTATAKSDGSVLEFTNLEYGYYVVKTAQGEAPITVTSTNPNASIWDKSSTMPTPGEGGLKKVGEGEDNVYIGQTVTYTVTFNTTNFIGSENDQDRVISYTITDNPSNGLEISKENGVVSVTIDDEPYTVKDKDNNDVAPQFNAAGSITIPWAKKNATNEYEALYNNGAQIVITYKAKVTADPTIDGTGNGNNVTISWVREHGTGNSTDATKLTATETVYTYALAIQKVDATGKKLAGATFSIAGIEATKEENGVYIVSKTGSDVTKPTTMECDDNGLLIVKGVKTGTYNVTEQSAPDGYNKLTASFPAIAQTTGVAVTTTTTYYDAEGEVTDKEEDIVTRITSTQNELIAVATQVVNETGTTLPSTGGIGTTIFYAAGIVLMAGAVFFVVRRKRA